MPKTGLTPVQRLTRSYEKLTRDSDRIRNENPIGKARLQRRQRVTMGDKK